MDYRELKPSPVVAIAIHAGHEVRAELLPLMKASEELRLSEEDPHTERFAMHFPIAVWALTSRFEVDVNRSEDRAVYRAPEDCWGIELWHELPSAEMRARSLGKYRDRLALIDRLVDSAVSRFGYCILLDFHSYGYQREALVERWWDDGKPVFNVGTRQADERFRPLIEALLDALGRVEWAGRTVWAGENVVFRGGYVHQREQARHPGRVLVPSFEIKKVFMNERTGELYEPQFTSFIDDTVERIAAVLDELHVLVPELAGPDPVSWR